MKELSIEEKARAYDEAINRAKSKIKNDKDHVLYEDDIIEIFPELYESEDDRIRKELTDYIKSKFENSCSPTPSKNILGNWIAWLEKQGDKPLFTYDDILALQCCMETSKKVQEDKELYEQLQSLHDRLHDAYWLEKQGEQSNEEPQVYETRDGEVITYSESKGYKVAEPKFKFGDWIILTAGELSVTLQIINVDINRERYWFNDGSYLPFADEECMHLWTINDAKAGDVLYYSDDIIVIFKYFHDDSSFCSYCYIDGGVFYTSNDRTPVWWVNNVFYPATEEQRDILFQKMKEEGYQWDKNKKELIKL